MTINSSTGVFSWTPTESQGSAIPYSVTITVTDNGLNAANLTDFETFTITVAEVNVAPVLASIGNKNVDEQALLSFTASATDQDLPVQTLTYSLDAASVTAGMTINSSTGVFSWTPTESQGSAIPYSVTITVTDNGLNAANLTDFETFTITVAEVNVAPVLASIGNKNVDEQVLLSFTASATDQDLPVQTLTYSLDAASVTAGMTINSSTGVFSWTPTESQGSAIPYSVTITVTDNGLNAVNLTDFETFTITVAEVNVAPVLASIGNKTTPWGDLVSFIATATDQDLPVQTLTYSLDAASVTAGMTINSSTGVFSWTPTELQVGATYSVTIIVTDNGLNVANLTDFKTFNITVTKRATTLTYNGDVTEQYSDVTNLSATLLGNASGVGVSGKTITFRIGSQSVTAITDSNGVATAILKLTQSPIPTYYVVTTFAGDGSYLDSNDTDSFDIQQEDADVEYTGPEFVGEQNSTATTTPVLLSASVNDIMDSLGLEGDIRNARVQFYDINGGDISGWLTPGLVTPGDVTKGIVNFSWLASVPNSGYNSTTIGIRVGTQSPEQNGYYIGNGQSVINVYRVSLNEFITGGGHIIPTDSKGLYASDPRRKVNFGFNVKWNKSMKNLQGNLNLLFRKDGKVYQIKSTAMNSLSIISTNPCSQKATFTSKANLNEVTNSASTFSMGGLSLQVTMTDNGDPGKSDMIGFTLMDSNNLVYSSSWPSNKTLESFLNGGNLVVHNGVTCTAGTSTAAISSTKTPSNVGDSVTFKATITGAVYVPSGTVVFKDGTSTLATITMSGGTASYSTTALTLGEHVITAFYSGDTKFSPSSSSLTQTVNASTARSSSVVTAKQIIAAPGLEQLAFNVIAYPNPSNNQFTLAIEGGSNEKVEVKVFDLLGRLVKVINKSDAQPTLFGEDLPSGSYITIINQGIETKTVRLIKK